MNYFPNNDEEIALIKFISKYQYLNVNDAKYFFSSQKYYKKRITNLVCKKLLRRIKLNLVLGELGIKYVKLFNYEYHILNRNKKYFSRLLYLSNLGAFFNNCDKVKFIPSFDLKDKNSYTSISRKFVGKLRISSIEYLVYYISKKHDNKYISNIIYDIQKEKTYKNIIILTDDIDRIKTNNFVFGMNRVLIVEDTLENREKLKYLHSVDWSKIIIDNYSSKVHLSEYKFCDYTDCNNKFISTFYFIDTEKINKIEYFLVENKNKKADIICSRDIKDKLQIQLPTCKILDVNLQDYIDKEYKIYD